MTTHPIDTTVSLRVQIYRLQAELSDVRVRLAGTEDRLADAQEMAQEWRRLYRELWEEREEREDL